MENVFHLSKMYRKIYLLFLCSPFWAKWPSVALFCIMWPLPLTQTTSVSLCVSCNAELISLALVEIEIKQHVSSTELLLRLEMCIESYSLLTGFCYDQPMGPQLLLPKVLIASQQNCDKGFRDRTPRTENKSFRDGLWPHFSKKNKTVNYNLYRPLLLLYFFGNNNHLLNT